MHGIKVIKNVVVKLFAFAISSPDEFLVVSWRDTRKTEQSLCCEYADSKVVQRSTLFHKKMSLLCLAIMLTYMNWFL